MHSVTAGQASANLLEIHSWRRFAAAGLNYSPMPWPFARRSTCVTYPPTMHATHLTRFPGSEGFATMKVCVAIRCSMIWTPFCCAQLLLIVIGFLWNLADCSFFHCRKLLATPVQVFNRRPLYFGISRSRLFVPC